jgi:nucleotide-binding universal stress UspA family protein
MNEQPIIAGVDGSEESLRAAEWAAREATARQTTLRIVSAPALPPRMSPDPAGRETVAGVVYRATRDSLARAAVRAAELEPGLAIDTEMLSGPPAAALLREAAGASMLVLGSRGTGGFAAMLLGSASRYLATHAPCPVVVAREETMAVHREIVVGIRDPAESAAVLGFAFEEAALRSARLLAVHAWYWYLPGVAPAGALAGAQRAAVDPREVSATAGERLDSALAPWREKYPDVPTGWEIVHAHPARVLTGLSARADLVVLGHRSGGSALGSVVYATLNHAHGPVATVPSS